jgi:geranylgeranyl diphosphate synthase type 3
MSGGNGDGPAASDKGGNGVPYSKCNDHEQDKVLLEPFTYLLQVPGKNIRKKLLHAFNLWLDVEQKKGELI